MPTLTPDHLAAANRPRRIVVQYDAMGQLGVDFAEWMDFRFNYLDQPGSQVDCVIWDIGGGSWATYPSEVLAPLEDPGLRRWRDQGIDWVQELVTATRQRGLEAFWNHRVSEVDLSPTPEMEPGIELMMRDMNPVKRDHPDWVIKTWWWQGLWNYASRELREYQLAILRGLAESYEFDGFQLDFARHMPVLPVGRQWELRGEVTEFVRMVRGMLEEVAARRGRPYLLCARVPETVGGCSEDGLDIAAWVGEGLVDMLTLGSRSMTVDVAGFRALVGERNVKLQPCFDDHHATDGYRFQPIEFLRGVFANWWQQGADSVVTFNWTNAPPDVCEEVISRRWVRSGFNEPGPVAQGQAYREVGEPATLAGKEKTFAVERRGGYPWSEGYFNHNRDAALPATLRNDGTALPLRVFVSDSVSQAPESVANLTLRAVLFAAREGDRFAATLNGTPLDLVTCDHAWKDPQILSPDPQPASGGPGNPAVNPDQQLLRVEWAIPPEACRQGANEATVAIQSRVPYCAQDIALEKLEVHLAYR